MIQLVELVTVDNEDLAYHYGSDNIDEVFEHERFFNELIKDIPLSFSSHILATEDASFDSLCEKDPYFKQFLAYHDLKFFIKKIKEKSQLTDEEVAGYLKTQFNLHAFPLQKVLYYSYADYLESKGHCLFSASFQAFDHGPVDRKVWRKAQDNLKELQEKNYDFVQKAALNPSIKEFIDNSVKKYANFFDSGQRFENSDQNPTHNNGTPWNRAYSKGRNTLLSDDDIKKYHYLEQIP